MGLSPYERVMTAVALREPDRVPMIPRAKGFSIKQTGLKIRECFGDPGKYIDAQLKLIQDFSFDAVTDLYSGAPLFNEFLGGDLIYEEGAPPAAAPVLTSIEEVRKLGPVNMATLRRMEDVFQGVRKLKDEVKGDYPVVVSVPTAFRSAALLRGVENFYMDMIMHPLRVHDLLRFCVDMSKSYAGVVIDAGADIVFTSNSVANRGCISRKHYEEFVTAYEKDLNSFLKSRKRIIMTHTCGDWSDRFDLVVAEGPDVLFVAGEADLGHLKTTYGDKVCIMGNVPAVEVMFRATPDDVEKACATCIEEAAGGGGFILSGDCELPPGTPPENLRAMERAGRTFGLYAENSSG